MKSRYRFLKCITVLKYEWKKFRKALLDAFIFFIFHRPLWSWFVCVGSSVYCTALSDSSHTEEGTTLVYENALQITSEKFRWMKVLIIPSYIVFHVSTTAHHDSIISIHLILLHIRKADGTSSQPMQRIQMGSFKVPCPFTER